MSEPEQNWRSQVPREERVRVLHHILIKIREFVSGTPEVKEKIRKLESNSYSSATSYSDYLGKIANAIGHIQNRTKQAQAKQTIASFAQGNLANQQTQAALGQQLRQRQHEALLRRSQLMDPRQLQYQPQQDPLQQQAKQQDPNRRSSAAVQRPQGSASDPKASPQNVQGGKPAQIAAQNPSLANRGNIPTTAVQSSMRLDSEDYRRKLQANGKQAAFNSAFLANGAGLPDEYLMALARSQQFPNGSQPPAHVPGHNPQQAQPSNPAQAQLPPGSVMLNVLNSHQQLFQQQEAAQHHSPGTSVRRPPQAMLQQRVNQPGSVLRDGMIVNPQARINDRYAATVAAIAKAAAAIGLNYTPEQLRMLSPPQLQQVAHAISQHSSRLSSAVAQGTMPMNQQVRRNDAQISANPHLSAGMGTNMASWMSRSGNAAKGGNNQVGVGQVQIPSQTMPLDARKQARQNGSSSRTSAGGSSGKSDANNAAVTVPQMNEILARQNPLKVDKSGNSTQNNKIVEALQDPSGVRSSPVARLAASGHLHAGGAVAGGLASSRALSGQRAATTGNVSEEEIWAKLENLQRKYRENMQRLLPVIHKLQEPRPQEDRRLFMNRLKDVVSILNMPRTSPTLKRLTLKSLDTAEEFIRGVLYVHTRYVEEKNSRPRSAQPGANRKDYPGQVSRRGAHGSETPSQATSRLPTAGMMHHLKPDIGLPQGVASELDVQRQQQIEQQRIRQLLHMQQSQSPGYAHGVPSNGGHANLSKGASQNTAGKSGAQRPRRNSKAARASQGLPISRAVSGVISGQQRHQHAQVHRQGQVGVGAQQQAQATANATAAATGASLESQAAKAQAEVQGLGQVQAKAQGSLYPTDQVSRMEQLRAQRNVQSHAQLVGPKSQGLATSSINRQMPQRGGSNMPGTAVPDTGPGPSRVKRPELTIQQRLQIVDARVKEACEQARKLEAMREAEIERDKSERIQTTLAALRNTSDTTSGDGDKARGIKRQASLVDVDNVGPKEGVIKPKTVFECSSEAGLRLAKRPKNEAADLRSLREAVEADCKAAKERNPLLLVEIYEEFGLPVVTCLLRIPEIRLPKLVLRVQRGYPRKGGATYGFERPPMGWIGVLEDIRTRFKRGLATTPTASVGVAAFLHVWATAADAVINGSCLSESR